MLRGVPDSGTIEGYTKEEGSIDCQSTDPCNENADALASALVQLGKLDCFGQKSHRLLELRINFKHHAIRAVITPE
jgi:hypothetical protein